jgi:hypothetical protein
MGCEELKSGEEESSLVRSIDPTTPLNQVSSILMWTGSNISVESQPICQRELLLCP